MNRSGSAAGTGGGSGPISGASPARIRFAGDLNIEAVGHGKAHVVSTTLSNRGIDHDLVGTTDGFGPASLAQTRRLLASWRERYWRLRRRFWRERNEISGRPERVWLRNLPMPESELRTRAEKDPNWLTESYWGASHYVPAIYLDETDQIWCHTTIGRYDSPDLPQLEALLTTFAEHRQATVRLESRELDEDEGRGYEVAIELMRDFPRGATVADAWRFVDDAKALVDASEGGELPRHGAEDLLCAGRWDAFLGQPESEWLEVKGAPYNAGTQPNWRFELAKDVAAFANSESGGMIVFGLTTKDSGDGEIVTGIKEFPLGLVKAATYRSHVAQLIHPQIEGLEITRIDGRRKGYGLVLLKIPPQSRSNLPFLVKGTLRDGDVLGQHLLWVVRRSDGTATMDVAAVHDRLRLGDQVVKGTLGS